MADFLGERVDPDEQPAQEARCIRRALHPA